MNCFVTIIAKENQAPNPPNPKLTQNPKPEAISRTKKNPMDLVLVHAYGFRMFRNFSGRFLKERKFFRM
jgi:hypothetical protein